MSVGESRGIGDNVIEDYTIYGNHVNKERHVPKLEDGLKPVYRRMILTALEEPAGKMVKAAKLIGDNMSCFTGDTKILCADGRCRSINLISQLLDDGKEVYTYSVNPKGSEVVKSRIDIVIPREPRQIVKITLNNGDSFNCTPNHRFLTSNGCYIPAQDLSYQETIVTVRPNGVKKLTGLRMVDRVSCGTQKVYDLAIDHPYHNFTLESGIVVKNCRHPHGDQGIINVVAELVHAGIFKGQGAFGSKGMVKWADYPPAAPRYPEVMMDPKWRELIGKLLPYVPKSENDYGKLDPEYIVSPYPLGLQFGSFGIGVGLSVNLPAFEPKSMIKAALAVLTNRPEPWKYLEANYGLTIPDEDKELFWNSNSGILHYNFTVTPDFSGGLSGWAITGDPSFVKPRTSKLFKLKDNDGKLVIRDESAGGKQKLFIARPKRIKTITDTEVENLVREAAEVPKFFSLYAVYKGQTRPLTGGVWITKCLQQYVKAFNAYKADQISKVDFEILVFQNFKVVADKILNSNEDYSKIAKSCNTTEEVVKKIASMSVGTLRNTDPQKRIESLNGKRKSLEALKVTDLLSEFTK